MAMISIDQLMGNEGPSYPEQIVAPYRKELTDAGFIQMMDVADIDRVVGGNLGKVVLVVLNSVCGCSARVSRPGALLSFFNHVVPDVKATVFAGMEKAAVVHFREKYLSGITPSSPNIIVLKDGKVLLHLQRHQIETTDAGTIADALIACYNAHCSFATGDADRAALRNYFIQTYQIDPLAQTPEA
ncbi:MAG: BrxA/BrxB family bacilliredoxin [Bacteroidetes bacterium]|nr:BrxA/BrxB family bacilliredoxin [Bacteroidota bacterium]